MALLDSAHSRDQRVIERGLPPHGPRDRRVTARHVRLQQRVVHHCLIHCVVVLRQIVIVVVVVCRSPKRGYIIVGRVPLLGEHSEDSGLVIVCLKEVLVVDEADQLLVVPLEFFDERAQTLQLLRIDLNAAVCAANIRPELIVLNHDGIRVLARLIKVEV